MSAIVSSSPVVSECKALNVAESECKALNLSPSGSEKKVRMPTSLPAKYGKFIQFGYFLMNKLNSIGESVEDEDTPPLVDEQVFLAKLMVFESLENQQAFVQEFLDSSKEINQGLRKMVQLRKRELAKADKPKKEKKEKKVKADKPKKESEGEGEPKEKKVRGKKAKQPTTEDQLVNELVQLATTDEPSKKDAAKAAVAKLIAEVAPTEDAPEVRQEIYSELAQQKKAASPVKVAVKVPKAPKENKEPAVKAPKEYNEPTFKAPKEKKEPAVKAPKENKEPAVKAPKEKKEPPVKAPKEKKDQVTTPTPPEHPAQHADADDNDELQVSVFEHNEIKYLIDDDLTVYDFNTQLTIGNFINHTFTLY